MKKVFFSLILITCTMVVVAQNFATVSGRAIDADNGKNLPFATIAVNKSSDNKLVVGTITDDNGRFSIYGLLKGDYKVECSFIGYKPQIIDLHIGDLNKQFDLGKIELKSTSEKLSEVTIKAQQSIVSSRLDKKTFNLDENIIQSGGSVMDAMRSMPGITVDQEDKIILRGSDKVSVLIDGRQSALTGFGNQKGLDNIPVSNIQSIEIINNPSAKYDASGMAGIVNIVYKKERNEGLNGDVGMALAYGVLAKKKEDLPTELGSYSFNPKYVPSFNLNYKTEKLNLFFQSEVLSQEKLPNNEFTSRYYDDGRITLSQVPENRKQTHYLFKGGMDWYLDDNNILTFSGIYDFESHVDTAQVPYINGLTNKRYRYWAWNEEEQTGFVNVNANYKHKFIQPGHELNLNAQYTKGWEDETYYLNDSSSVRQAGDKTHIIATEHTTAFTADYQKPLKGGRLELGAKLQLRRIPVEYTIESGAQTVIYPGMGNWSEWGENIYAAYGNYIYETPKYAIEAGLRVEQTDVYYDISPENIYYQQNDSYSYFKLFPNVRLSLNLDEKNSFSFFYNHRVDRPGEPELRIFPKYDDPELLKVGNPYLRPQFTQTFELAYRKKWSGGSAFISAYHKNIEDYFMRIYAIDYSSEYEIINKIYQNTGTAKNSGFEIIANQTLSKAYRISGSFNWYNNVINEHEGVMLFPYERAFKIDETNDNTWDFKINNQISLSSNVEINVSAVYYAAKNIPQGEQLARSSIDAGIKKKIMKGKGEILLSMTDILNDFGIRQNYNGDGFTAKYENYFETQLVRLGIKYKF